MTREAVAAGQGSPARRAGTAPRRAHRIPRPRVRTAMPNCAPKSSRCSPRTTTPAPSSRNRRRRPQTVTTIPDALGVGAQIGPYRIVQLIAEGGMGAVYQAVRVDDLYRKVVADQGRSAAAYTASTRCAISIPNARSWRTWIIPISPSCSTAAPRPDGRPYFVMDFIAGTPIDEYCDDHRLTLSDRIRTSSSPCAPRFTTHTRTWSSTATSSRRTSWSPKRAPSSCSISASPSCSIRTRSPPGRPPSPPCRR